MATRKVVYMPLDELRDADAPRNSKQHNAALIRASLGRFGYVELIHMDDRTGKIVAGHGRRDLIVALHDEGESPPERFDVRVTKGVWQVPVVRGWASTDDDDALAAGIALNQVGPAGGWENEALLEDLHRLQLTDLGLGGVGFTDADFAGLAPDAQGASAGGEDSTGDLLALADVSVGEPIALVQRGDVWTLGDKPKHTLVVADVMTGWAEWVDFLYDDTVILCVYPGPYVALSERGKTVPLLLVQPDPYIAGHIVDKWLSINPSSAEKVVRVESGAV